MGLQVYGNFKVTDAVNFTGSVAYVEPEDDDNTDTDSAIIYNIGVKYAFMANSSLAAQVQYVDIDEDDVDELLSAEVKLSVNF